MPRRHTPQNRLDSAVRAVGLFALAPLLLLLSVPKALEIGRGPWIGFAARNLVVASVDPRGPAAAAGLRTGDRLVAAGGRQLTTAVDWLAVSESRPLPETLEVVIRRGEQQLAFPIVATPPTSGRTIWATGQYLSGLAFLLIGWWVLWRRRDQVARDFFALCLIFAVQLMEVWTPTLQGWITLREVVLDLSQLLLPPLFLRFFLAFPSLERLPVQDQRRRRLLLLPVIPLFLFSLWAQFARIDPQSHLVTIAQVAATLYLLVCFVAALVIFARKALRRDRPVQQTKLRVVLLGLIAGLVPFLVGMILGSMPGGANVLHHEWLGFSLGLVPFTFGLAILRYGALDAEYVVRHGLVYAVLTLMLALAYIVTVGLAGQALRNAFGIDADPLALLLVAGSALFALPLRRGVQLWIDRSLYPARRATRAAIVELGRELTGLIDSNEAAWTLASRLSELYRPQRLSLFLRQPRENVLVEVVGWDGAHPVETARRLELESNLAGTLFALGRPVFAEEIVDAAAADTESGPCEAMAMLGCELLVPLVTGNRLTGLLALGSKSEGGLYTQDDVANLHLLAVQSAAQLENTRLYQESLARERLAVELSVAQEIQARLVPAEPLDLPGLRLLGRMEPSREVGGDYYDYFLLPDQRIGVAIADASGKGIPAALLMAQLSAAFRSMAVSEPWPERVVSRLNDTTCTPEAPGHLVSFFYGVLDPLCGRMEYCNAGMNPPLLFRRDGGRTEELRRGGPVLGASPNRAYRRGTVRLDKGDLVLFFTDGLTEETSASGDFFELERLVQIARDNLGRPLEQLRERIFASVAAFAGAERSDDRTLILLEVKAL